MRTHQSPVQEFQFYLADLDTLILVEVEEGAVVVRATRGNVSERRKWAFVRQLALEGFIPEEYQWFAQPDEVSFRGVKWVVDRSWLERDSGWRRRTNRFMCRLLVFGTLVCLASLALL